MPKPRKEVETGQLNLFATPIPTINRFRDFVYLFKKKRNPKASDSQIGAMLLNIGMDSGFKELEKESDNNE